jgi:hypothetical protein
MEDSDVDIFDLKKIFKAKVWNERLGKIVLFV